MMYMFEWRGLWYIEVREPGRTRVYQLETATPRITWKTS